MRYPWQQRAADSLTAAAAPVGTVIEDVRTGSGYKGKLAEWQERAFYYYDHLGEIWYAAQFGARIGRVDYFPEYRIKTDEGDVWQRVPSQAPGPDATDAERQAWAEYAAEFAVAIETWDRVQDPNGGRVGIFSTLGRLRFLIGESVLFLHFDTMELPPGALASEGPTVETWESLSPTEVKVEKTSTGVQYERTTERDESGNPRRYTPVADLANPQAGEAILWRFWRKHPTRSSDADCALRALLDSCEELLLLRRVIRARARSRIGAGVLVLPTEAFPATQLPRNGDGTVDPMKVPTTAAIIRGITTAIGDEQSVSAVAPTMVWASAQYVDKFKFLSLNESARAAYPEAQVRAELVADIARGLDLPGEYLTGMGDVNHWGQWFIDDQSWKQHLEPSAQEAADDMSAVFYRPFLAAQQVEDVDMFRIGLDPSAIIIRPDRSKDADAAFDRGALGFEPYREAKGWDKSDAPTDDEWERILKVLGKGQAASAPAPADGQGSDQQPPPGASTNGHTLTADVGLPDLAWVNGALDMALLRCREIAGSRLRNQLRSYDPSLAADHADTPAHALPAALGTELVTAILGEPHPARNMVRHGSATLAAALAARGVSAEAVHAVCQGIEQEAARHLFDVAVPA